MFPTENLIGIHLVLTDADRPDLGEGPQVVISEDFSANTPADAEMSDSVEQELGEQAQKAIDRYRKLALFYAKPAYQTKVTQIDNNLQL